MKPLLWSNWLALLIAAVPFLWLMWIELGTSRKVSLGERALDTEIDRSTSRLFDLVVGATVISAVSASFLLEGFTVEPRPVSFVAGVITMFGAITFSIYARAHLGRFHRHTLTSHHDHELVESGPYRHVRHPLYTATIFAFIGIGAVLGNWLSIGLFGVLPTLVLVRRIRIEESILNDRLDDTYRKFCQGRARLLPYVW